jgi:hypothetical protein
LRQVAAAKKQENRLLKKNQRKRFYIALRGSNKASDSRLGMQEGNMVYGMKREFLDQQHAFHAIYHLVLQSAE